MVTLSDIQAEMQRREPAQPEPENNLLGIVQAEQQARGTIPAQPAQSVDPSFLQRIGGDLTRRKETILDIIDRRGPSANRSKLEAFFELPATTALGIGQVAGGVADIAGETIATGLGAVIPEGVKEFSKEKLQSFAQTDIGLKALSAFQTGGEIYQNFREANPDAAQALEGALNITGIGLGKKGVDLARKEVSDVLTDVGTLSTKAVPETVDKQLAITVRQGLEKSIRPSVAGKKSASQATRFFKRGEEAVKTIIENKGNLNLTDEFGDIAQGLPQNLRQFSEAIDSTKKKLFTEFDSLAKEAGEAGITVDTAKIASELDTIINNKGFRASSPDIVNYAQSVKENLLDVGSLSPAEAQNAIAALNAKLGTVKDFNSAAKSYVDSVVVNNMRKSLDEAVEGATGKQFQILKNKYGALKEIERDVARRAMVDARKNNKGILDFTDVFTGASAVQGIASMQAGPVAAGTIGKFIATYQKAKNDPNRIVKKLFEDAEKLVEKSRAAKEPFAPQSKTLQAIGGQ